MNRLDTTSENQATGSIFDVLVVGAGFGGLYALHRLRGLGYRVRVLEAGSGVGGTWFWNRYPGARCDVESMQYSFSFSDEIQQEWEWSHLYAAQPEILRYINFVADKLGLRRDIQLDTRVEAVTFDDAEHRWELRTEAGERLSARFVVMATGCLSIPLEPTIPGLADFGGRVLRTSDWPVDGMDVAGLRVGLIGTGSSGIQATPILAEKAERLTIFQRTPNYSIPAHNRALAPDYIQDWKRNYRERRLAARRTRNNTLNDAGPKPGREFSREQRELEFEKRWLEGGGIAFMYTYTDMTTDPEVNAHASDFVRSKIARVVKDPETAAKLMPKDYGIGGKRICVDTEYFETFNRENVTLVDIRAEPIEAVTTDGLRTATREYPLDVLVLAIGFDAMTGALLRMNITGRQGVRLADHWEDGPRTYLGMALAGFPNLFIITGPGSPSVFTNMVTSVEQHVDWIAECIDTMKATGRKTIEATPDAEADWFAHVNEVGNRTILPNANSWYVGANVPGKPRVVMPYMGGAASYIERCRQIAKDGYQGFNVG